VGLTFHVTFPNSITMSGYLLTSRLQHETIRGKQPLSFYKLTATCHPCYSVAGAGEACAEGPVEQALTLGRGAAPTGLRVNTDQLCGTGAIGGEANHVVCDG